MVALPVQMKRTKDRAADGSPKQLLRRKHACIESLIESCALPRPQLCILASVQPYEKAQRTTACLLSPPKKTLLSVVHKHFSLPRPAWREAAPSSGGAP